ncbi:MAG: NADH-quinone oxidoreductase subunit L [bacterium]
MAQLFWTAPIWCAIAALITALFFVPRRKATWVAALPTVLAVCWSAVLAIFAWQAKTHNLDVRIDWLRIGDWTVMVGAHLDGLSAMMMVIVTSVSLMVQIYSIGYMAGDPGFAKYFSFMGLFTAAMLGLVLADNLLLLYMCWELVGLCSYLLIGFWYHKPEAASAAKKAFIVTRFGDVGFLLGMILISFAAKTFDIATIQAQVQSGTLTPLFGALPAFAGVVALLIFCGAAGKSAQFPLHIWLPDAMEGPTPVSALIHAATMVAAGVFLVARMFFLFEVSPLALQVVTIIGALTAFMGATIALVQTDIKRILAYSTISQLGYMMMALGLADKVAAMFHLGTHAYFKSLLFLTAGSVIHAVHSQDISELGGLGKKLKITAATALIGGLALAGFPGLSGFWSKDEILAAALHRGNMFALGAGLLTALLTAFYMTRFWVLTFMGKPRSDKAANAHESPAVMTLPLLALAVVAVIGGYAAPSVKEALAHGEAGSLMSYPLMLTATLISLIGISGGYLFYRNGLAQGDPLHKALIKPVYIFFERKWFIDDFFTHFVAAGVLVFARVIAWIDRHIIDGTVNLIAGLMGIAGSKLRLLTNGQAQFYAFVLIISILATMLVMLEQLSR